jgi:hypothetical protein
MGDTHAENTPEYSENIIPHLTSADLTLRGVGYSSTMNIPLLNITIMFFLATAVTDGEDQPHKKPWERHAAAKIKFQLDDIRPDGLRGPADGLVSVSYEFCVRADDRFYQEVRWIDPSVQIYPNSSGRIACPKGQALCIGQTNQPHWRDVLRRLSSLSYISEIRECFFE